MSVTNIKYQQNAVVAEQDGEKIKAKVWYSTGTRRRSKDLPYEPCITIYENGDYWSDKAFRAIFTDFKNETDVQTDYFDDSSVSIFQDDPRYPLALAAYEAKQASINKRRAKK